MIKKELTWYSVDEKLPDSNGKYLIMYERTWFIVIYKTAWFSLSGSTLHCLNDDLSKRRNVWYEYDSEYGDVPIREVKYWAEIPRIGE